MNVYVKHLASAERAWHGVVPLHTQLIGLNTLQTN